MAKILTPPKVDVILSNHGFESCVPYIMEYRAIDQKGRYLHWDELKRRVPKDKIPELAWFATKFARMSISKSLTILENPEATISFCVPDSLQAYLHQIDKVAGGNIGSNDMNLLQNRQAQQKYLVSSLLMEEAITSSQLEGAVTTRRVAKEMLTTERPPKDKSERMILNNYRLMREAVRRKDEPLSLEFILQLHELATSGAIENEAEPGVLRNSDDIHIRDQDQEVVHNPPSFVYLEKYLENLCNFANSNHSDLTSDEFIHPVIKSIILHFLIGYIHPFGDGNGRTARALFYWFMLKSGYWLFEYVSISKLLKEAPMKYGRSFLKCETDDNDVTYFLYDQITVVTHAINDLMEHLKRKQNDYYDFMNLLDNSPTAMKLTWRQKEILKKAVKNPGKIFTVKEIQNDFAITPATARTDLQQLEKLKMLVTTKDGRTVQYIAHARILEMLKL